MHSISSFTFFNLLSSLLSGVVALGTLYRCDVRIPATTKAEGGFKSKGGGPATQENIFKHVSCWLYKEEPFIFIPDCNDCQQYGSYRSTIDPSTISNKIWDVNAEFKKAGKANHNDDEYE